MDYTMFVAITVPISLTFDVKPSASAFRKAVLGNVLSHPVFESTKVFDSFIDKITDTEA